MSTYKKTLGTSVVLIASIFSSLALSKTLTVDPAASELLWTGKKVTGQHNGKVQLKSGTVEVDKNALKAGQFEVDMTTLKVDDITDATNNAKLAGHLKSDDFFGVEKFPTATFKITGVKELKGSKDATHEITGDLTIKGKTAPATFPAQVAIKGDEATMKGTLVVDRTKYDVRYGSGKFFQNLGDKVIYDNFDVALNLKTKK